MTFIGTLQEFVKNLHPFCPEEALPVERQLKVYAHDFMESFISNFQQLLEPFLSQLEFLDQQIRYRC